MHRQPARTGEDPAIAPSHGRGGQGWASIIPHLNRQQEINDKPADVLAPPGESPELRSVPSELAAVMAEHAEALRRAGELRAQGAAPCAISEAMERVERLQEQVNAVHRKLRRAHEDASRG